MHSFTPLRRTYSAVSSSLSSSDETRCGDQELGSASQARFSKLGPRTIHRHSFLIRLIIFVLLEFGFIALVSAALRKPIILHLSFTTIEVKAAVTAIAIFWHALAVFVVKDILLNIFSAEWIRQDDGSSSLTLQELDIVSRLTTGFVDQAKHFVSKRATPSFRLGFLSLLLLISLNGLGPSAIGTNFVPYICPSNILVANLTVGVLPEIIDNLHGALTASRYAHSIIQVEIIANLTTVGYSATQPNILIPWPSLYAMPTNTTMTYESDVIRYNFSCSWVVPSISNLTIPVWRVGDVQWVTYDLPLAGLTPRIHPLSHVNVTSDWDIYPDWDVLTRDRSLTYFIFIGGGAASGGLNLEDIPSLNLPCNTTMNPTFSEGGPLTCDPELVSFLECNPQLEVLPATINATASSLESTIQSGAPTIKNIPIPAANAIFASGLLDVTSEAGVSGLFNDISKRLFLPNLWHKGLLKPLSLQEINQNMNNIFATSAKAYLGGYTPGDDDLLSPPLATVNTTAIMEVQKMALVGIKPFLVASSVIVGLLVVLLSVLVTITRPDQLECFELETIIKRLQLNYFSSSNT